MELNFHYHGTYTAAAAAGFSPDEALVIARAAQYVDDCGGETVQGTGQLIWKNLLDAIPGRNQEIQTVLTIWPVFHFLPGNFSDIDPYVNPLLRDVSKPHLQLAPQLICGTESALTAAIVQGAKDDYAGSQDKTKSLQRVGITMHVLADTFAHQGFAGIPLSLINEASDVRRAEPGGELEKKRYYPFSYSPALSSGSFGYLGHGRIGHLPDQPGETFTYRAAWRNAARDGWITRYNPLEFYCAYLQMKEAMEYIRGSGAGFSNAVDRELLLDQRRDEWPRARPFLEALEKAGSDKGFPVPWYEVAAPIRRPRDYEPYDAGRECALRESFLAAAADHRSLVLGACEALRNYLALFS